MLEKQFNEVLQHKGYRLDNTKEIRWKLDNKMITIQYGNKEALVIMREKEEIEKNGNIWEMYVMKFSGVLRTQREMLLILNIYERNFKS